MTHLLHISSSPRGESSRSLALASRFIDEHGRAHPDADISHWDLWDGTLPPFGPAAAHAKMATLSGVDLTAEQRVAYQQATDAFSRFDSADHYLFSVPMWNASIPYILKQFIDVVSQPGFVFDLDPQTGYAGLLRNKKAVVLYTSSVWAPGRPPGFGENFQSTYLENWLRWAGIEDITPIRLHVPASGSDRDHELSRTRQAITDAALAL